MTQTISSTKTNTVGNGESQQPALDTTGQFVAFASDALNLSTYALGLSAIYLKNTQTGDLTPISTNSYGEFADSNASNPSISGDGRYVVFQTAAANLTTDDKNSASDIFLKDTQTDALSLVAGKVGNGESLNAKISTDGHYVVFQSVASNFVSNDFNGAYDIYLQDLQTNTLKLISTNNLGVEGNHASYEPNLSANGSVIAFASDADNLVTGDNNINRDVFVKNTSSGAIQLISTSFKGGAANGLSDSPNLSSDGTKIAFRSFASDLVANSVNDGNADIYVKDLTTQKLTQINFALDGSTANGTSWNPIISPDGNFVAFISDATNLVANDTNDVADVFLENLSTGKLKIISDSSTGTGDVTSIAFSGDSSTLAFSRLSGLDDNATTNVYSAKIQVPIIIVDNPPTGSVIITGTTTQGQTLTASTNTIADLDGLGTFSYQWLSNNNPIQGETNSSHAISANDVGQSIAVKVNFVDGKGNTETETSQTVIPTSPVVVPSIPPGHVSVVKFTGTVVNDIITINNSQSYNYYNGGVGDDVYIISPKLTKNIEISDATGLNTINLPNGMTLTKIVFSANGVQYTLNSGTTITINSSHADNLKFVFGNLNQDADLTTSAGQT
ncbi:MAG: hypothetical protein PHN45_08945, partial [Methylococcales bacterium]|nr:hypothetical protein [Methylococcales bacterium]